MLGNSLFNLREWNYEAVKDSAGILNGFSTVLNGTKTGLNFATKIPQIAQLIKNADNFSDIANSLSVGGDLFSIAGTIFSAKVRIDDIDNDDDLTERERNINKADVRIASAIGIGLNVASIVCTCTGVGAPVGVILKLAETIVTSDSGVESITSTVNCVVESCEEIGESVSKAYETGKVDMGAIGNNFVDSVGDAVKTGGEIVTNAWEQLKESDGILDSVGNAINLVCAPVSAVTAVVTNTVVSAATTVVNTVASGVAAAVKLITKW